MNIQNKYNQIVKDVVMTDFEKNVMKSSLIWHIRSNKTPVHSPFYRHSMFRTSMAFVFILLVSGSGVAFASKSALPGDSTYGLKLQIEEIKGITKTTPKEKLVWQKKRAETRLQEMKTLLATKEASPEKIAIASKELESHIQAAKNTALIISETDNENDHQEALVTVKDLEQNIEKDAKVISALSNDEGTAKADLQESISKNKDSMTEAIKNIALPKKVETDQLDKDVLDVQTDFDTVDAPAGTGEDRFIEQAQ